MIKKLSKLFIILILMVLPKGVFAIEYEHNHILSIEKFDIEGSKIKLEGYSYVSHIDNWGGENLSTYIVAYTDDYSKNFDNDSWKDNCDTSSKCYAKKASDVARNMWYARCTDNGCKEVASGISAYEDTRNRRNNVSEFTNSCAGEAVNQCLYENVGFTVTVDLADIASKFSGGNDSFGDNINFSIISVAKTKDQTYYRNSPLRVYTPICKVNGSECSTTINSGDYTYTLTGLSDTVKFDAVMAKVRKNTGDSIAGVYFQEGLRYEVLSYSVFVKTLDKIVDGNKVGTFDDILLQLDSIKTDDDYVHEVHGTFGKKVVPNSNGKNHFGGWNDNGHDYYAIATHVIFDGKIVIRGFKPRVKTVDCGDVGDFPNSRNINNEINCGNNKNYEECMRKDVSGTIYVKSISNGCQNFSNNGENIAKVNINGVRYVPVNISTEVLFKQQATFTFGSITPNSVRAGKGFSLGSTSYNNIVTWMNAKMYEDSNKPYYEYKYIDADSSCNIKDNLDINNISGNNKYCYYNSSSSSYNCSNNLADISLEVINQGAKSNIKIGDAAESYIDEYISFISCDSNDSSGCYDGNPTTDVGGSWDISRNLSETYSNNGYNRGEKVTQEFNYSLFKSYVALHGGESGKVFYPNPDDELNFENDNFYKGINKYYVDFKYASNILPFDLYGESNPSFVDDMVWNLKGTCDVEVKEGYYDIPEPDPSPDPGVPNPGTPIGFLYKYRSISLSNPFPKGNIPTNWADWYGDITNQNRISGTYDKGVIYQYNLNKSSLAGGTSNDYSGMEGINKDGSSDFVDFGTSASNESYCEIGYFSDDCDK